LKARLAQVKTAMVTDHTSGDWKTDLAGALDWWRDAGVDLSFTDAPARWIAPAADFADSSPAAQVAEPAPERAPPRLGGDGASWPQELADFSQWWLAEPSLDPGPLAERVAPRGMVGARLMVIVEHPEREDRETLLSGAEGALLGAFLNAAGISAESVYFASALPRCTPLPDWAALKNEGLGSILAHHVALARPERAILFGTTVSSLFDHDPAQTGQNLPVLNHEGQSVPMLVAPGLGSMLARPARKAALWGRWLDWTGRD
jgi:DNA polymerase